MTGMQLAQLLLMVGPDFMDELMKLIHADPTHNITPEEWKALRDKIKKPFNELWPIQN